MEASNKISEELKLKIKVLLKKVLQQEHKNINKTMIKDMPGRISFACPYCGDSYKDDKKKRGNIYWDSLQYHCFNCQHHGDAYSILKDHNIRFNNTEDSIQVIEWIKNNKVESAHIDVLQYGIFDKITKIAPTVEELRIKLKMSYISVGDAPWQYLRKRLLSNKLENFLYSYKDKRIYILNIGPDSKVIGMQSRSIDTNNSSKSKYLTYDLIKILDWMGITVDVTEEEKTSIGKISTLFGIMQTDFTRTVTVFEGPLDRLFMNNSIALSTAGRDTTEIDEVPTIRYMFDNDMTGKVKMIEKLKLGKSVFMWSKFIKETKIDKYTDTKIKDLNDLVLVAYVNKSECLSKINNYFSNSSLDAYYL
jgi:hypothetical protein